MVNLPETSIPQEWSPIFFLQASRRLPEAAPAYLDLLRIPGLKGGLAPLELPPTAQPASPLRNSLTTTPMPEPSRLPATAAAETSSPFIVKVCSQVLGSGFALCFYRELRCSSLGCQSARRALDPSSLAQASRVCPIDSTILQTLGHAKLGEP